MPVAKRFIGAGNLPRSLSVFDVQHSFCMSAEDFVAASSDCGDVEPIAEVIYLLRFELVSA